MVGRGDQLWWEEGINGQVVADGRLFRVRG